MFERLTLKPVAYPKHEKMSSFPPTVFILYYAQEVTPTIEGIYLTVILNEALGGIIPE